jgi:hypothetical protein
MEGGRSGREENNWNNLKNFFSCYHCCSRVNHTTTQMNKESFSFFSVQDTTSGFMSMREIENRELDSFTSKRDIFSGNDAGSWVMVMRIFFQFVSVRLQFSRQTRQVKTAQIIQTSLF